jgi:O-antigen ligase
MKEIFYIEDTPVNKISYYFLLVFLVALPFDRIFSELALFGLLVHTLIHPARERKFSLRWPGWLILALYLISLEGMLYSARPGDAWNECVKQLAILLFPLIACFTSLDWQKYRDRLLNAFGFTCFFTALYLYGIALLSIRDQHLPLTALSGPDFINHAFTAPIDLHATYFSIYTAISFVHFVRLSLQAKRSLRRVFYLAVSLVLLATIMQLASRAVCISVFIILNVLLPYFLRKPKVRWIFLAISLSVTAFIVGTLFGNKTYHTRYTVQLKQDLHGVTGKKEDPEPRMARWNCAWELIRASPLIGYGTGTEVALLKKKYLDHHLYISYAFDLNAHNEYLSFLLKTGLPGLLLYLGLLGVSCVKAFQWRDPLLMSFLVIVIIVSFSENILDTNKGIFFFGFFFSLFLYRPADYRLAAERLPGPGRAGKRKSWFRHIAHGG